jgi:type II secretory ATPase GspE/PulE/Tfp pilus assembly ATPase PilB-like protein
VSVELVVDRWIQTAVERRASDIHIEPVGDEKIRVRIRQDGELHTLETVSDAPKVIARVKVMAGLDVNEHQHPLDGRIHVESGRLGFDLRVSVNPCMGGEKVVLRLVDSSRLGNKLDDIGMTPRMLERYKPLASSPNGLCLHVGPTGSGKTTSLYAAIQTLNRPEINVQTVEDPVEYVVPGITQTQVNHDLGLSFPKVLRALLRQDPNVILVGEIRDTETAEIAIEAALTGHLVFSTLHTNDAVGTVVRLIDMGIAPYSIAYALRAVVAQRFVRVLCQECKKQGPPPEEFVKLTGVNKPIFSAEGCKACGRDGYTGRVPLFELMPMSLPLRKAIYAVASPDALLGAAQKNGLITLWHDGVDKVYGGITSLEEMLRVTKGVKELPKTAGPAAARPRPPIRPAGAPPAARPQAAAAPKPRPRA